MGTKIHSNAPFGSEARVTAFWNHVDSTGGPDGCWLWTGYAEKGYGAYWFRGRMYGAHELALSFTTGEARPDGFDTCHSCDTPLCCNPSHLRFDTRLSNVHDSIERKRHAHGAGNGGAKLTEADVLNIRERAAAGAKFKTLAAEFGVSPGLVSGIVHGKRWTHVGGPLKTTHGNQKHGRYARKDKVT